MSKATTMTLLLVCLLFGALAVGASSEQSPDAESVTTVSTDPVFGYLVFDTDKPVGQGTSFGCAFVCNTHADCGGAACGWRYCGTDGICTEC